MNQFCKELLTALHQFQRLRLGDLFPEISQVDCMVLTSIEHLSRKKDGKLTVSELAEHIHLKPSAVSRSLKGLEDRGWIDRAVNKTDRRIVYVTPTEAGVTEVRNVQQTMDEVFSAVFSQIKEEDMRRLLNYLDELYQITQKEIETRSKKRKEI